MKRQLVDPVHFFDARGRSVVSNDHLEARIRELESENARLRKIIVRQHNRMTEERATPPPPPTQH